MRKFITCALIAVLLSAISYSTPSVKEGAPPGIVMVQADLSNVFLPSAVVAIEHNDVALQAVSVFKEVEVTFLNSRSLERIDPGREVRTNSISHNKIYSQSKFLPARYINPVYKLQRSYCKVLTPPDIVYTT